MLRGPVSRRYFVSLLASGAVAWPFAVRAQQGAMPAIGFIRANTPEASVAVLAAFRQGLSETGYVEKQNITIEYRWAAQGHYDQLPALAADLVRRKVSVIAATTAQAAVAAKAATASIPIVFETGLDPIQLGLVVSLNRPGGNITGVTQLSSELLSKRLGLLHDVLPAAATIGFLVNPTYPGAESQARDLQEAARTLGLQVHVLNAGTETEINTAFANFAKLRVGALFVGAGPYAGRAKQFATLAARHALPTFYQYREYVAAGGLISYGASLTDSYRQAGVYAGRIIKGEKPADLPVLQPTKFEFVINLKTAKALGLTVPPDVLSLADEVIE
jgi:putative ABC transport system substrate-binding protein